MKTTRSLSLAYDYIRNKIISSEFPPGSRLTTRSLSMETGVSRTPIRDALRLLEKEGLVEIQPRVGASVKAFDFLTFEEVCELRLGLESFSAALAAEKRTFTELVEIESACLAMGELIKGWRVSGNPELGLELRRRDIRFHFAIATAAHNREVLREIMRLQIVFHMACGPMPADVATDEKLILEREEAQAAHCRIFEAIRDREHANARREMQQHMQEGHDRALILIARRERQQAVANVTLPILGRPAWPHAPA